MCKVINIMEYQIWFQGDILSLMLLIVSLIAHGTAGSLLRFELLLLKLELAKVSPS